MIKSEEVYWTPERVRALRQALGLTQEELAKKLNRRCIGFTVSRWERGLVPPSRFYRGQLERLERKLKKKGERT